MKSVVMLLFILFHLTLLWSKSIDAEIEAIQKAPVSERFKLMNALKKKLVKMKEKERIEALSKLRASTKSKKARKAIGEVEKRSKNIARQHLEEEIENEIENQVQESNEASEGDNDD